ncbi:glycine C-acetyltransferase [candidate division KSB1 bacterium]|nr:glycine C-acetyltransferase [candidate division KSB1 bacterium]
MFAQFKNLVKKQLEEIHESGLYKDERIITTPQGAEINVKDGKTVLNFCANNYLGLANDPRIIRAAKETLDTWGYGMSSVRFICGTLDIHKELERRVSNFLRTEDTILYAACFDANGGVFEPFVDPESAILTDSLNHASIIDGIRLTKAQRFIYAHSDMNDLEEKLKQARNARVRLIATDGVFSMDGDLANLPDICTLAQRYDALVLVDDSHATGFMGTQGRGTHEHFNVEDKIDLITTTFGKALGGASGGCVSGHKEMIDLLRQKSRPYLFSNTLAPVVVGATIALLDMLSETTRLRDQLSENTLYFRQRMTELGFDIKPGIHPIVPIMLYEEKLAHTLADQLLEEGIYVIGFSYPVVPKGKARIRVQISASHTREHLDRAITAFDKVARGHGVI